MPRFAAFLLACACALAGCSPKMPRIDLSGMTLPRFELYRYGVRDPAISTTPYKLTRQDLVDVKTAFSAVFTDGRTLEFGPIAARRKTDGSLAICGLVNVRNTDSRATGMRLFDGTGEFDPFDVLRFTPNRLATVNGKALDIYSDCRDLGVF